MTSERVRTKARTEQSRCRDQFPCLPAVRRKKLPGRSPRRSHTSNCKISGHESIQNDRLSGAILHSFCVLNRKFGKSWHLDCNSQYSADETLWRERMSQSRSRSIAIKTSTAPKKKCGRYAARLIGSTKSSSSAAQSTTPTIRESVFERYLQLQNDRLFIHRKSSLFRDNSPLFLHFQ